MLIKPRTTPETDPARFYSQEDMWANGMKNYTRECYRIIHDEEALDRFIWNFLPGDEDDERYYLTLFSRKKYLGDGVHRQSDKAQLKRVVTDRGRMRQKIEQLEVPYGAYRINGEPVPQDSLALYINPNPRSLRRASFDAIIGLSRRLRENEIGFRPDMEAMNAIQQSKGRRVFMDFDIDDPEFDFSCLENKINLDCCSLVVTRGGYHLLIKFDEIDDQYKKTWYNSIKTLEGVDQSGDQLLPVPGCIQGGHVPELTGFHGAPFA